MNILMISDVYFPRVNGVSTSIATVRSALHKSGHRTLLLAPQYPDCSQPEADIIRIPARYLCFDPEDRVMRLRPLLQHLHTLQPARFDIVHIHTPFQAHRAGIHFARQHGLPVVETYHTFFEEYFHHYLPLLPRSWLRLAAREVSRRLENHLDGLIVPSPSIEQALRRYGIRIPIRIIPTGLNLTEFTPGDKKRFCHRHGLGSHRPTLVYIGRVAHEKNIGFLLDVVNRVRNRLPDVLLIVAGEGPATKALQQRTTRLRLTDNVAFIGYQQRGQQLWDCYAAGDIFVFASKTETQGLVLLEALALGVPVIATGELGAQDMLKDCGGALLVPNDVADFAAQTLRLLCDPKLRRVLGENARMDASHWSIEQTTADLVAYYASLIEGGDSPATPLTNRGSCAEEKKS
jgi:glycosyltransferase involved in cell wall biosynthesis